MHLKIAERFENLDNILYDWANENIQKGLVVSFLGNSLKKYSSSLSRQSNKVTEIKNEIGLQINFKVSHCLHSET